MRQWALIHFSQFVSPHSDSFQQVFASPEPSKSTEHPLKQQQIHQTNVKKLNLSIFALWERDMDGVAKAAPCNQAFFVQKDCIQAVISQPFHSPPPSLSPGTVLTCFWSTDGNTYFRGGGQLHGCVHPWMEIIADESWRLLFFWAVLSCHTLQRAGCCQRWLQLYQMSFSAVSWCEIVLWLWNVFWDPTSR